MQNTWIKLLDSYAFLLQSLYERFEASDTLSMDGQKPHHHLYSKESVMGLE